MRVVVERRTEEGNVIVRHNNVEYVTPEDELDDHVERVLNLLNYLKKAEDVLREIGSDQDHEEVKRMISYYSKVLAGLTGEEE